MGRADYLELGTNNALCDRCQKKYKANQLKKEWTGWMVCDSCWEPRHPQEFLKGHDEDENVPWSRPDSDADTNTTTVDGSLLTTINSNQNNGDVSAVLTFGQTASIQYWNTELTEDRVARLSSLNAQSGDRFIIYKDVDDGKTLYITSVVLDAGTTV